MHDVIFVWLFISISIRGYFIKKIYLPQDIQSKVICVYIQKVFVRTGMLPNYVCGLLIS